MTKFEHGDMQQVSEKTQLCLLTTGTDFKQLLADVKRLNTNASGSLSNDCLTNLQIHDGNPDKLKPGPIGPIVVGGDGNPHKPGPIVVGGDGNPHKPGPIVVGGDGNPVHKPIVVGGDGNPVHKPIVLDGGHPVTKPIVLDGYPVSKPIVLDGTFIQQHGGALPKHIGQTAPYQS